MSVICVGDFGKVCKGQGDVAKLIKQIIGEKKVELILGLGDNIYPSGVKSVDDKKFKVQFEEPFSKLPKNIKFYNVLGNHDYMGNTNAQIEYTEKSKRWRLIDHWYHFTETIGKSLVGFYALDTNFDELTLDMKTRQQSDILKCLQGSKCDWNIVYGHHPFKSTGYHGNSKGHLQEFYQILIDTGKIHIILSGHDHDQQLFTVPNTPTLVVSGAGCEIRPVPLLYRNDPFLKYFSESLGVCQLEFTKKELSIVFYSVGSKKKIVKKIIKR